MNFKNTALRASLAAAFALCATAASAAPILYVGDNGGILGTVDVATGAATVIGNMGHVMVDIAFDPNGNLWGIDGGNLYTINKNTGASTLVGATGVGFVNALTFASDGTLYAAGGDLVTLNTATGAGTTVGGLGFGSSGDLAFHNGVLYLSAVNGDLLVAVDTGTGAGTLVGNMGVPAMYGLANGDDNVLYGTSGTTVYTINAGTGAATQVAVWGGGQLEGAYGAAFYAEAGAAPAPGVLALLGLGLVGLGALRRRNAA